LRCLVRQPGGVSFGDLELLLENRVNTSQQVLLSRRQHKSVSHNQRVVTLHRQLPLVPTVGWAARFGHLAAVWPFLVVAKHPTLAVPLQNWGGATPKSAVFFKTDCSPKSNCQ
ncbi:unnamed protein product, partial [Choristocarpus tenellus]